MAENAPLHRHPDLLGKGQRPMLNADFKNMTAAFEIADYDPSDKERMQFPVNGQASRNFLLTALGQVRQMLAKSLGVPENRIECPALDGKDPGEGENSLVLVIRGMENNAENQRKFADAVRKIAPDVEVLLAQAESPDKQAVLMAADRFLDICPMEKAWKPGMNADQAADGLMAAAADNGIDLERDELERAMAAHINELLQEGRQLSPEQMDFMEYMRENGEVQRLDVPSPIRMRPQPGAKM